MACNCIEVKQQIAELLSILSPIWTKLNQLSGSDPAINGTVNNSDTTASTEHSEPMDETSSPQISPIDASRVTLRSTKRNFGDVGVAESDSQLAKQPKLTKVTLANLIAKKAVEKLLTKTSEPSTNLTRSLYVSPFDPSTKSTDIMDLFMENDDLKHITDSVNVISLASKRKNQKLTFVSFKIDVPRQYYDQISNSNVWNMDENDSNSERLIVKEFIQKEKATKKVVPNKNVTAKTSNNATKNSPKPKNTSGTVKTQKSRPKAQVTKRNVNKMAVHRPQLDHQPKLKQQNICQKACCPSKRPQPVVKNLCNSCTGHCGGNRFDSQPRYCN